MTLRDAIQANGPVWLAAGGFLIGAAFGAIVYRTNFCTMGAVRDVSHVKVAHPAETKLFPRGYQIELSTDNATWTLINKKKEPNWSTVEESFPTQQARYVRITQTATPNPKWPTPWAISEFVADNPSRSPGRRARR